MRSQIFRWLAMAVALVGGLAAAEAQTVVNLSHRPAAVPAAYVITPFGYFDASCVVHLAEGDELRASQGIIRHSNGTTVSTPTCSFPHYRADGEKVERDERAIQTPDISHAWVEYAGVSNNTAYGSLYAEWSVPPTPTSNDGQTLFYFTGFEDTNDVVTILQPVLGWNSDYKSAWGIASWNCCQNGTVYEAPSQPASPGDTIFGYMWNNCAAGTLTCTAWNIVTWDLQNNKYSQLLSTSNFNQTFNWAFGGVLEVYNIAQCSDYPTRTGYWGSGDISFNQIGLYNYKGNRVTSPPWTQSVTSGLTPSCSYQVGLPNQVILKAN
jgi:hypothetical protein